MHIGPGANGGANGEGTGGVRSGVSGQSAGAELALVVGDPALLPGIATGIGSLPHTDPSDAAALVLDATAELPAVPQLPRRSPRAGMVAQWLGVVPGVQIADNGSVRLTDLASAREPARIPPDALDAALAGPAHDGWRAFIDAFDALDLAEARAAVPGARSRRVKVQVTGPLTLGAALVAAGAPVGPALDLAAEVTSAWATHLVVRLACRFPGVHVVVFLDEPALAAWRTGEPLVHADEAIDRLSAVLARIPAATGVHVCTGGDIRVACEAGPMVVAVDAGDDLTDAALPLSRHLEGGGWIAWGAVPTNRPIGESPEPLWRRLVEQWCELTRRGCDPFALRARALLSPACGLATHGVSQAERALRLAHLIGRRVGDQAAATRLTIGA